MSIQQDKRFFQLVFTPFISSAISGDIDPRANVDIMVKRLKEMPEKLRNELLASLELELKVSAIKLRNLQGTLKTAYQKKLDAIESLLAEF